MSDYPSSPPPSNPPASAPASEVPTVPTLEVVPPEARRDTQPETVAPPDAPVPPEPPPPPVSAPALDNASSPFVRVVRAYGMLFLEGLSLGLGLWNLRVRDKLPPYIANNDLGKRGRTFLLGNMAAVAALACLAASVILFWSWRRKRTAAGVDWVHRIAWRCAPLIVFGLVPPLFQWRLWLDCELTFLAMATLVVLGLQPLVRVALSTQPVWMPTLGERLRRRRLIARLEPTLARVRRVLPWVILFGGMAGYATFFAYKTVRAHRALYTMSLDLGLEDNLSGTRSTWRGRS